MIRLIAIFIFVVPLLSTIQAQMDSIFTGVSNREILTSEVYQEWYQQYYYDYDPSNRVLQDLEIPESLHIDIVLADWCSDSRREVPRFFKVLDVWGYTGEVPLYFVDKNKKDPAGLTTKWYIEKVPTIIFSIEGEEIGRIVETPDKSLEKDLRNILKAAEY